MDNEYTAFHDKVALEIERRKLEVLLADGTITPEDLENVTVVEVQPSCHCGKNLAYIEGTVPKCPQCGKPGEEISKL